VLLIRQLLLKSQPGAACMCVAGGGVRSDNSQGVAHALALPQPAARHEIPAALRVHPQLILAFTSNWTPTGGVPQYLQWAGSTNQVGIAHLEETASCYLLP
jgi:hypothetical protein